MGSDLILPALLPPPDPMTQGHRLRLYVVIISEASWIWVIFFTSPNSTCLTEK